MTIPKVRDVGLWNFSKGLFGTIKRKNVSVSKNVACWKVIALISRNMCIIKTQREFVFRNHIFQFELPIHWDREINSSWPEKKIKMGEKKTLSTLELNNNNNKSLSQDGAHRYAKINSRSGEEMWSRYVI